MSSGIEDGSGEARAAALVRIAAGQASEGLVQLMRATDDGVFEEETIELLADALKLALEAEAAIGPVGSHKGQLHAAVSKFLEGWA